MYTIQLGLNGQFGNAMYAYKTLAAAKRKAATEVAQWAACPPHLAKRIQAQGTAPTHLRVVNPEGAVVETLAYHQF